MGEIGTGATCSQAAVYAAQMCYTVARSNRKPPETSENTAKPREIVLHGV